MKTFVVLLCLVVAAHAFKETLKTILKSPKKTRQLYKDFKAEQHLKFGSSLEEGKRYRQFKKNARFVALANEHSTTTKFALNFFSTMTRAEKRQYTGLNMTRHFANSPEFSPSLESHKDMLPFWERRIWTFEGGVTKVSHQGSCGSCWAFAAVAALETRYRVETGVLRKFSEQEYLDCTYEEHKNEEGNKKDGCQGGNPQHCYTYTAKSGQLASLAQYPYTGRDGRCKTDRGNALIGAKILGFVEVGGSEIENIKAIYHGSIFIAVVATDSLYQYSKGIMKDTTCTGEPDHAVTAVGYSPEYILIKNSWGAQWGERGFVRIARNNHRNCGMFEQSLYPKLVKTKRRDVSKSDPAVYFWF